MTALFNPFSLDGRVILVTGASSGIGMACALNCEKAGAVLHLLGRSEKKINNVLSSLQEKSHNYSLGDLTIKEDLNKIISEIGLIDGLVLNAGITLPKPFSFYADHEIREVFELNYFSNVYLIQGLLKAKKLKKDSAIVFVSSIAGNHITSYGSSIYGSSKAAIQALAKNLALELARFNIRVNAVAPGMIDTGIMNNSSISMEDLNADKLKYPLKRYGTPDEVAYAVIYLLSNASAWVTGTSLIIDGGYTIL